jgi:hypothetical protein
MSSAQGQHEMTAYSHPHITKAAFLAEIAKHQEQDKISRGTYWDWEAGRGCAIGCAFASIANITNGLMVPDTRDNHQLLSIYLAIDEDLLRAEDFLFEKLPEERAQQWPLEFSEAVPAGADTSSIVNRLIAAVMRGLYASAIDTPPEWGTIACRIADGIDAGWGVKEWLNLRTEFPDESWSLPQRAVTYLLTKLRGGTFLKNDALQDFLLRVDYIDPGMVWTADTLLGLLRASPMGIAA